MLYTFDSCGFDSIAIEDKVPFLVSLFELPSTLLSWKSSVNSTHNVKTIARKQYFQELSIIKWKHKLCERSVKQLRRLTEHIINEDDMIFYYLFAKKGYAI